MSQEDRYENWKKGRRRFNAPTNFSALVMKRIKNADSQHAINIFTGFLAVPSLPEKALRILVAFGLSAAGIFRISYVALNLLTP